MKTKYTIPNISIEEKRNYLKSHGGEQSWSEDNWVRSDARNKEANTGSDTESAYYYQYGIDAGLTYSVVR
jgi:hypothetical protein